jgi:hypothetical protein
MTRAYAEITPTPRLAHAAAVTEREFSTGFDRCFARVWAYVSRRVHDRESCERIVREVLTGNLDLLVHRVGQRQELSQLKAASDRLIGPTNQLRPPPTMSQG